MLCNVVFICSIFIVVQLTKELGAWLLCRDVIGPVRLVCDRSCQPALAVSRSSVPLPAGSRGVYMIDVLVHRRFY